MFKLQCPIPKKYYNKNGKVELTQLFGENRNDFYRQLGLPGHNGVDFRTKFTWMWIQNWFSGRTETGVDERKGIIPILASHNGYLQMPLNNDRTRGVYQKILSDEVEIDGKKCKVETVYFHLDRVRRYVGDGIDKENYVRAGSIIGYSDNTGVYTTGAHLHWGMKILWKQSNGTYKETNDAYKGYVDPLKYVTFKYTI